MFGFSVLLITAVIFVSDDQKNIKFVLISLFQHCYICCNRREIVTTDEQEQCLTDKILMDALKIENNLLKELNYELKIKMPY